MQDPISIYTASKLEPATPDVFQIQSVRLIPNSSFAAGLVLGQVASANVNDQQTLTFTGPPTAGTYTLSYNGQTTVPIPFNASALQVQIALQNLLNINLGQVACTGGPGPGTGIVITFVGLMAGLPINPITVNYAGLNTGTAVITHSTTGVAYGFYEAYAMGNTDGSQFPKAILTYACSTDDRGQVSYVDQYSASTGLVGTGGLSVQAYYVGVFRVADLTGFDANCLNTTLGGPFRLLYGASISDPNALVELF